MKLSIFLLLITVSFFSCKEDDSAIKNTYSITAAIAEPYYGLSTEYGFTLYKDDQLVTTGAGTPFTFDNLEEGAHYTIIPLPLEPSRNGLSTLDMVNIENHVNGIEMLDALEQLKADVNLDNNITLVDWDIVRNCILSGVECPGWRYATTDYDGSGNGSTDRVDYPSLFGNQQVTFTVFKLGDVNCTTCPG